LFELLLVDSFTLNFQKEGVQMKKILGIVTVAGTFLLGGFVEAENNHSLFLESVEIINNSTGNRFSLVEGEAIHPQAKTMMQEVDLSEENVSESFFDPEIMAQIETLQVLGKQMWQFVVNNEPQSTIEEHYAHVVPSDVKSWTELELWSRPESMTLQVNYRNFFHRVAEIKYRISFSHSGSYEGKGAYLANIHIIPEDVAVKGLGHTVDASAKMLQAVNVGTKDSPIAGVQIQISWTVDNIMRKNKGSMLIYLEGSGFSKAVR